MVTFAESCLSMVILGRVCPELGVEHVTVKARHERGFSTFPRRLGASGLEAKI